MGFTSGFTGGVTLTLGIAYLTVLAHRRNREQQAAVLRQQTYLVSVISDPLPPTLPPTRSETAALERANLLDTAKDKWNAEIHHAAHLAQTTDWHKVRDGVETAVARLWARLFADAQDAAEEGEEKAAAAARRLETKAEDKARGDADGIAAAAESAYANATAKATDVAGKAEEKAADARGSFLGAIGKGVEKGKQVFGRTKAAVVNAENKIESEVDQALSPVERTMRQRYEKPALIDQSVEDALAARYIPEDRRDPVKLRGL